MTKILVVSDTHGNLENLDFLINYEKPNVILHAGDYCVNKQELINLNCIFVDGNNDYQYIDRQLIEIEGIKILLLHGHKEFRYNIQKWHENLRKIGLSFFADIVIYGHSHKEIFDDSSLPIIFNPGSLTYPRNRNKEKTYGIIVINCKNIKCYIKKLQW